MQIIRENIVKDLYISNIVILPLWIQVHLASCWYLKWHPWQLVLDPCPGCHGSTEIVSGRISMMSASEHSAIGHKPESGTHFFSSCVTTPIISVSQMLVFDYYRLAQKSHFIRINRRHLALHKQAPNWFFFKYWSKVLVWSIHHFISSI